MNDAPLADTPLRSAPLPRGILVTAIERGKEVIPPDGDTVIRSGDRLMVLGSSDDLSRLKRLASTPS